MTRRKTMKLGRIVAAIAFAVTIVINALANIIPLNGMTTGQISDAYPNLFAPAAVTFSIWSLIYVLLAAYTLYQLGIVRHKQFKLSEIVLDKVTSYFIATSFVNALWIVAWHYKVIWLSVFLMIGLLYCLAKIADILRKQRFTAVETVIIRAPFSIYFGWITVALIANITTWLVSLRWDGWGIAADIWMAVILLVGASIALMTALRNSDWLYLLVPVWAYYGIVVKHIMPTGWAGRYQLVIMTAVALMAVMAMVTGYIIRDDQQVYSRKKFWIF